MRERDGQGEKEGKDREGGGEREFGGRWGGRECSSQWKALGVVSCCHFSPRHSKMVTEFASDLTA